jgi:hypothetical protein
LGILCLKETMDNKIYKEVTARHSELTRTRYCSNCSMYQSAGTGKWIKLQGGTRQRWKCGGCIQRAKERLQTIS